MHEEIATENLVLVDWVSITSKIHDVSHWLSDLGMQRCSWEAGRGARGYAHRTYFEGISIMHDTGSSDYQTWLEMSGSGCRSFETYGSGNFDYLFSMVRNSPGDMNLTRLDVAFDDHTGILDINRICDDVVAQNYVSRSREWECIVSSKGKSCVIGSPTSDIRIRIYDKAAERKLTDGRHWVRVELQLRDQRALDFASKPLDVSLSERFLSVLLNYLRFVEPDPEDSNKSRWPMSDYWSELCAGVRAVKIFSKPGKAYNLDYSLHYVLGSPVNSIRACLDALGTDEFIKQVKKSPVKYTQRYQNAVDAYRKGKCKKKPTRLLWFAVFGRRYRFRRKANDPKYLYCTRCDSLKPFADFSMYQAGQGICRACMRHST